MPLPGFGPNLRPILKVTGIVGTLGMVFGTVMVSFTADLKWGYPFLVGMPMVLLWTIGLIFVPSGAAARMQELVSTGVPAVARLEDARRTGWIVNEVDVQMELTLTVQPQQGEPYRAVTKTLVPMWEVGKLTAGKTLAIRVDPEDPSRVAIDLDPPKELLERIGHPKQSPVSTDEILATGSPATAQVVDIQLTGKTTGQVGGSPAHPERDSYPAVVLDLLVQPPTGAGFTVEAIYSVPPGRLAHLTRGNLVPVRYVDYAGTPLVAVDWDASRPDAAR